MQKNYAYQKVLAVLLLFDKRGIINTMENKYIEGTGKSMRHVKIKDKEELLLLLM